MLSNLREQHSITYDEHVAVRIRRRHTAAKARLAWQLLKTLGFTPESIKKPADIAPPYAARRPHAVSALPAAPSVARSA
jgi:hypothetical protein